jgi:hypothetical protein
MSLQVFAESSAGIVVASTRHGGDVSEWIAFERIHAQLGMPTVSQSNRTSRSVWSRTGPVRKSAARLRPGVAHGPVPSPASLSTAFGDRFAIPSRRAKG